MVEPYPSAEALTWAALAAGEPVQVVRRLPGGTHAATHLLTTTETRRELVLRRFPHGDTAAANEARVLDVLDGLDGWAPQLLGADPDGHRCGGPAVLITRLPGRADITSVAPDTAAVQLGRVLARLHGMPLTSLTGLRDGMAAALASPTRNEATAPGAQALLAHGHRLAEAEHVLTHYDFWSGNVLWDDGALTGVIDWSGASRAPRGFDVSWCRLDLVLLHGPHTAETFTNAYQEAAGKPIPDLPLWDVFALTNSHHAVETWLPNYHDLGRTDLTAEDLRKRHTAWTDRRLPRCP
ncbi:phosphotransferase family protein [Actinomadura sp. 1N219]|uniref:phosphotransferase family protein n=1 Tax=Actinomadura sp. 1N219 TaxID=3375152 RepID=UPI003798B2B5